MPYEILPNIFLGDIKDAENVDNSFGLVINCTKNISFTNPNIPGIRIPVNDSPDSSEQLIMYNHWMDYKTFNDIHNTIISGKDVLIHCQMGRQRSAATVVAYIMYSLNWPLDRTINFVKSKKPDAFFGSVNFIEALHNFSQQI